MVLLIVTARLPAALVGSVRNFEAIFLTPPLRRASEGSVASSPGSLG
jgi:hypothetical protein